MARSLTILNDFFSLLFPTYCLGCTGPLARGENVLCTGCLADLPKTNYHYFTENPVFSKLAGRLPLSFGSAFLKFRKGGMVQRLLHELKYNNHPEIGVRLGQAFGHDLLQRGFQSKFDGIIPVPLHFSRRRQRGYNQSAAFAEGLSEALGIWHDDSISIRQHATSSQTRKSRADRWANVEDMFSIRNASAILDKRILLVDDVITTGATLEACGSHLISAGCRSLGIACIADAL